MRQILCVLLLPLFVLVSAARPPQNATSPVQTPPGQAPGSIRVSTEVVIEEVAVKDKSEKPIEGLTASDFVLTEDGVPQTISFVEYQKLPPLAPSPEPPPPVPVVTTAPPATRIQIAPELPGDTR